MINTYLTKIIKTKAKRIEKLKLEGYYAKDKLEYKTLEDFPFYKALKKDGLSIIGEIKKASPSKGIIQANFKPIKMAKKYEESVEAISVLTEEDYFLGSDKYLKEVSERVKIPTLCKDFILDPLQIYKARELGASAVLLIVHMLTKDKLAEFIELAHSLGLDALVETHTKEEIEIALKAKANIIGINNRNLNTFVTSLDTTLNLRALIPKDIVVVSESGIKTTCDIEKLAKVNIDAILVGESFMLEEDVISLAKSFKITYAKECKKEVLKGTKIEVEEAKKKEISNISFAKVKEVEKLEKFEKKAKNKKKSIKLKTCGIKTKEEVELINKYQEICYAGFIFAESKRKIKRETCSEISKFLRADLKKVGVFVNEPKEELLKTIKECKLDLVQLHGDEDALYCKDLPVPFWKVIHIKNEKDYEKINNYPHAEAILLEPYVKGLRGGTGENLDWQNVGEFIKKTREKKSKAPKFILSGGLTPSNILLAIKTTKADVFDLNSGIEVNLIKNEAKIKELINNLKEV